MWRRWVDDPRVVVLTVGTGSTERIEMLREKNGLGVPIAHAPEGWTATVGVLAFPETIFLDTQGRVAERIPHATDEAHLEERLAALVAEASGAAVVYEPVAAPRHSWSSRLIFAVEGLLPHPGPAAPDPFTWSAKRRGGAVVVRLDIPRHHHVNRDQVEIVWTDAAGDHPVALPAGRLVQAPYAGETEQFTEDLVVALPEGAQPTSIRVRHRGCRDDLCYPPFERVLSVP